MEKHTLESFNWERLTPNQLGLLARFSDPTVKEVLSLIVQMLKNQEMENFTKGVKSNIGKNEALSAELFGVCRGIDRLNNVLQNVDKNLTIKK